MINLAQGVENHTKLGEFYIQFFIYSISNCNGNRRKIQWKYAFLGPSSDSLPFILYLFHNKFISFISAIETELHKTFIFKNTFSKGQLQRQKTILDGYYSDLIWHLKNVLHYYMHFSMIAILYILELVNKILITQHSQVNFIFTGFLTFITQKQCPIAQMILCVDIFFPEIYKGLYIFYLFLFTVFY